MFNKEFNKEELMQIVKHNDIIGQGVHGKVVYYDDNILFKIYCDGIYNLYENIDRIDEIICLNLFYGNQRDLYLSDVTKLQRIKYIYQSLQKTSAHDLIKGIATYKNYLVGIFLNYYQDYICLKDFKGDYNIIMKNIERELETFVENDICITDLNPDNILVRPSDLNIKFIDLDGDETMYKIDGYRHLGMYANIKEYSNICLNKIKKQLIK